MVRDIELKFTQGVGFFFLISRAKGPLHVGHTGSSSQSLERQISR